MIDEKLFLEFCKRRPEYALQANESTLYNVVSPPATVNSLCAAADHLEHKLLIAPAYKSAWDEYVFLNPDRNGTAFQREFFKKMRDKESQSAYVAEYNALIKELGEDLRGLQITDLRELAAVRRENHRRKSLSGEQLRELSRQENPRPLREELPRLYTPRGHTREIVLTPEVLRTAGQAGASLPYWDFKYLNSRYPGQINERMNAAAAPKYKPLPDNITRGEVIRALRGPAAHIWIRDFGRDALNRRIFHQDQIEILEK
jgi:hypothetical protein